MKQVEKREKKEKMREKKKKNYSGSEKMKP